MNHDLQFLIGSASIHFTAASRIYAQTWRSAYRGIIPDPYLDTQITEDRWIPFFQTYTASGAGQVLLLCPDGAPVACSAFGAAGDLCTAGLPRDLSHSWGEVVARYVSPQ